MTLPEHPILPETPYDLTDSLVKLVAEDIAGGGHCVMFVDDEPLALRALNAIYRRDYTVLTASGADEAIKQLEAFQGTVSAIFSDERMPGMRGDEFFEKIRDLYPLTRRILMTGYTDSARIILAINNGQIHRYISKPWDQAEFDRVLREAVATSVLMQRFTENLKSGRRSFNPGPR